MNIRRTAPLALALLALLAPLGTAATAADRQGEAPRAPHAGAQAWTGSWSAAPTVPFGAGISAEGFEDRTIRQPLRVSKGGERIRVRLSNVYGSTPLTIDALSVALPRGNGGIAPGSSTTVTFGGSGSVTIAPGTEVTSDPVDFAVRPDMDVIASLYVDEPTGPTTWHRLANRTVYLSDPGDHTQAVTAAPFPATTTSFFFVSGLEVATDGDPGSVVTFGDSLTDGVGSSLDAARSYPSVLARRLGGEVGVLNTGIGANQVINDTEYGSVGALGRFEQDVLTQPGVRDIIWLEGLNDILGAAYFPDEAPTAAEIIDAYSDVIDRAHARDLRIIGATLPPFRDAAEWTAAGEATRQTLNAWIRDESGFDGILDADAVWQDPADPVRLNPAYASGDGLHPNDAGYRALAESLDLSCLSVGPQVGAHLSEREDCTLS
jgi:lysophospholipase L1-like esterase